VMFRVPFEQAVNPVILEEIEEAAARRSTPEYRVYPIAQGKLLQDGSTTQQEDSLEPTRYIGNKWGGKYLRAPDIYFEIIETAAEKLVRLSDIAEIDSGINTRANDFFYVKRLPKDEWLSQPIENFTGRKIPAGCRVVESWVGRFKKTSKARDPFWPTRWLIEEKYLRPVITSPQEAPTIEVDPQTLERLVLSVYEDWLDLQSTYVREYLEFAKSSRKVTLPDGDKVEALQVNKRPELSKRKQSQGDGRKGGWWYSVRDKRYGHLLAPMASSDLFRVNYVQEIVPNDHNLFALCEVDDEREIGLCLYLNSTLAAVSRELLGRTNLGEGGLKTEGVDWALIPVPTVETLEEIEKRYGDPSSLFRRRIGPIAEEVKQPDKIRLDEVILGALGLARKVRVTLAEETVALVRRRIDKAVSLKPEIRRKRVEAAEKTRGIWANLPPEEEDEENEG
jgi:hypothetical protein